ncbi:hypothetical protein JCM5353_001702 [Sporobolomyces roseus]
MTRSHQKYTTLPLLPTELLNQIFRDKSLSHSDLASLALVSRQFLDGARRSLYKDVSVVVEEDDLREGHNLSLRSWQLLRTIQDDSRLAALIRTIRFFCQEKSLVTEPDGIPTTEHLTLITFLGLAQNTRRLHSTGFATCQDLQNALDEVGNCFAISEVALEHTNGLDLKHLSNQLPRLTHLSFKDLSDSCPETDACKKLASLDIEDSAARLQDTPLYPSPLSALRTLRINLDMVIELSYRFDSSEFPHLAELHAYPASATNRVSKMQRKTDVDEFWTFVSRLHSLQTLSFDGSPFQIYESELFEATLKLPVIPTLRTIRFERDLSVDRISSMLEWPLMLAIPRMVVPIPKRSPNTTLRKRRIEAVVAMCEGTGIEVMLSN